MNIGESFIVMFVFFPMFILRIIMKWLSDFIKK